MANDTPMIFEIGEWLDAKCTELSLPAPVLDFVGSEGESCAIIQTSAPVTEKEYINGKRICRIEFDILVQGSMEKREGYVNGLTDLCFAFEGMKDAILSEPSSRRVLQGSSTAPAIRSQTGNMFCRYGISVSLRYKEQ
ncbi:MAG: hypothetical protein ACTTJW_01025 [Sphaerochaeta sp.]